MLQLFFSRGTLGETSIISFYKLVGTLIILFDFV